MVQGVINTTAVLAEIVKLRQMRLQQLKQDSQQRTALDLLEHQGLAELSQIQCLVSRSHHILTQWYTHANAEGASSHFNTMIIGGHCFRGYCGMPHVL